MVSGDNLALPEDINIIGHVDPLIGRTLLHDVPGYFGFPLARKGDVVTKVTAEKAQNLGRLFELIEATEDI